MERDRFKTRTGFIIACIGSAVGMGNIWRFPIMVSKYGGMTFLIVYILFVILIASSGMIEEFALGRWAEAGPVGAFGKCTETKWGKRTIGSVIGAIPVIGAMGLAIGYTVVMGWIFKYCFMGISGQLFAMGTDMGTIGGSFDAAAPGADSLPEAVRMMLDGGIFTIGNSTWQIVGLLAALLIMAMGVSGGIEKANKIMMPLLFGLFLLLGIYIAFLPGSGEGYRYIFTLNPQGLADPEVWIFAFGQAFFSLSVAGNGSVIYGSYLDKREDLPGAARNVADFRHDRSNAGGAGDPACDGRGRRDTGYRRAGADVRLSGQRAQRHGWRPGGRHALLYLRAVRGARPRSSISTRCLWRSSRKSSDCAEYRRSR